MPTFEHAHAPVRVLLCDDQEIVGVALRQRLAAHEEIVIHHILDPRLLETALCTFEPTVILQDLVLDGCSGLDIVRQIRSDAKFSDVPILVLSTTEDPRTKFDAFAAGANDYIVKFPETFELVGRVTYHSKAFVALRAKEENQRALQQKSKLESLGTLAAGIAHEINTPLQYISSNLSYVRDSIGKLGTLISDAEIAPALEETIQGIDEISAIVRAMKAFAHPGKQEKVQISLNELVKDIEVLSKNEWRDIANVSLKLSDSLPLVLGSPSAIAHVLLNLVVNSAQAIRERTQKEPNFSGEIRIRSAISGSWAEIEITDNGGGIPLEIQTKIFEPFFTTKDVGVGSGQGLSLARATVVEGHHGELEFLSHPGVGTSFFLRLPLQGDV